MMSLIPEAKKKLERARSELVGVRNWSRRAPPWDFDQVQRHFDHFITVGRSVAQTLITEDKPRYDQWLGDLKKTSPTDHALFVYLRDERDSLLHAKCPQLVEVGEARVQEHELYSPHRRSPYYGSVHHSGPPGIPPPQLILPLHGFEVAGQKIEVYKGCERYLALLEDLLKGFEVAHSS